MNISNYNSDDFKSTYSPEDNKLRLYCDIRIDQEDWATMKKNGWRWAPKQELFFAYWTVAQEDFCLALAGDIFPEEMTMVERAEAKTDRLLILAQKRSNQSAGYQKAANDLMNRIGNSQPILIGHASERKAVKEEKQLERTINKAAETADAVGYWVWRAKGVIGHANYKNNTRTIYNRIKTLLKDLRAKQSHLNEASRYLGLLTKVSNNQDFEIREKHVLFCAGNNYKLNFGNCYSDLSDGKITSDEALEIMFRVCNNIINSTHNARVISHILNRLGYEQGQLSLVPKYEGELSPAILQTFLRTHGADKPKVSKHNYDWVAVLGVPLPLHIGNGFELELNENDWKELMVNVGYEVPAKRITKAKSPIVNFQTDKEFTWSRGYTPKKITQVSMTKAEYKAIGKDHTCTGISKCGEFRFRIGYIIVGQDKWGNDYEWKAVFINDSKVHETPDSYKDKELSHE